MLNSKFSNSFKLSKFIAGIFCKINDKNPTWKVVVCCDVCCFSNSVPAKSSFCELLAFINAGLANSIATLFSKPVISKKFL